MTIPFPYHRIRRTECLHCTHTATTTTGPPYCPLHTALISLKPQTTFPPDPNLRKAAQNATYKHTRQTITKALQQYASNQ